MSREAELIGNIDEHIGKSGGRYGLEFADRDLKVVRAALAEKSVRMSRIEAGDVVTDYGYHGKVVITNIDQRGLFEGYYVSDGVTVKNLNIEKFTKIADRSGEWKSCRGGVYFQKNNERNGGQYDRNKKRIDQAD